VEGISPNLNASNRLIFYVPGFKTGINKTNAELMRQTFKNVSNTHLIIIDHDEYTSGDYGTTQSYERSVSYTYYIGKALGDFLAGLRRLGFPSKNIHCVGHSLGSQMLGYAGVAYYNRTSEKVARITGIDPAGPCFSNALIDEQIRSGVADYVEVYHCNAGRLGTSAVLADTDFFFNKNGVAQPNCVGFFSSLVPGYRDYSLARCSHGECLRYWAKSVQNSEWFLAWSCDSYKRFKNGKCFGNQNTLAGYWNPGNVTGVFYVSTDRYDVE
jgi:pimeloyl-ACP methyl ester carboxylesterase